MTDLIAPVRHLLDGERGLWLAPGDGVAPDGCAVVATSGSTGTAKRVVLRREALLAAADAARERLGFTATWHLTLPPTYVAGLMVIVRGLAGDGVVETSLDALTPRPGRNAVSIVGTQLYRALQPGSDVARRLAAFDAVLVGGARLAPELRAQAEAAGIRVIETYGMSETCGGVVWDGVPLPGVDIRIGEHGRIAIAGPQTFDGYLDAPELTAETLVDGAVLTRDRGHVDGLRLVIDGRIDDVVISGGVNVDLAEVRAAVARLEPETEVIAVPDDEWGVRLVLFAPSGDLTSWRNLLRPHLPAAGLPRQVVITDRLPRTEGGKPDRAALAERAVTESAG
ncbi:MAG TPA: AMP-binding protein [Tessaracoccus flavescens]|uniref:AMP-binding protein n=1 Tax=Tessaracoccus flavescens TaxID=399497 RepID=A0A921JQP7_9ACTN|nr:AMP-binding protein [Tessaracoccus flavescens]